MKSLACILAVIASPLAAAASELVESKIESDLVPSPVEFAVLLPDGYSNLDAPVPLLLDLHGGGGDKSHLATFRPVYDQLWSQRRLPKMVVVTPSVASRCFYMDFKDGTEKWETFLTGPFLEHLRKNYNVQQDRAGTLLTGISMGGMGSLRLAFKHPDLFGAVASMEPGIEPILKYEEIRPKHRFWRSDALMHAAFGNPVDAEYWAANNPASIAQANPQKLRDSGLAIYVECGDEDQFWLYEGAEFLHQVLWDNRIKHEYHLVHGADHVGTSLIARKQEALEFLARTLNPPRESPRSAQVTRMLAPLKWRLKERDHYGTEGK